MSSLEELSLEVRSFATSRDWERFHTPKNLAMAISGEAGELAAEFQWLTPDESASLTGEQMKSVMFEIADVAIYLILLADTLSIDIEEAVRTKLKINEQRFPQST